MSAPDRDFGPVAKFYPARIPYLPRFFPALAEMIGLSKETVALDLACGTGELAVGFAPYCGSVLGIDRSGEMLSMRRSVPANVRFMQAELNSGALDIPEAADFVTIGRALHYLKPEALLPLLRASTKPSASVLICNSDIHRTTPWAHEYNKLIATYVDRINHPDFYGRRFFADSGWLPVRRPRAIGTFRCRVNHVLAHTFSFPRYADVLLRHEREFSERLRGVLKPYCLAGDRVDVDVVSDGIEYSRVRRRP